MRPSLETLAKQWPTPQAHDAMTPKTPEQIEAVRNRSVRSTNGGKPGMSNLNEIVAQWATPTARDWKDAACASADVPTNGLLGRQAPRSMSGGGDGMVLNPQFVEMLMGWPIGWTACASAVAASSPVKLPSLSAS